jgi:hypothetical protein
MSISSPVLPRLFSRDSNYSHPRNLYSHAPEYAHTDLKALSASPSEMCLTISVKRSSSLSSYGVQTENDFAIVFIGSKSLSLSSGGSMKPYIR